MTLILILIDSVYEYGALGWENKAKNALCQPALSIFAVNILDVCGQRGREKIGEVSHGWAI